MQMTHLQEDLGSTRKLDGTDLPRLEFVHITKTGGSAVEKAGAENGYKWGACHYLKLEEIGCTDPDVPYQAELFQSFEKTSPWHSPPKLLKEYVGDSKYPYGEANLFTVVRNPYDRVISEYYCPWLGFQAKYRMSKSNELDLDRNDPVNLNKWVVEMVTQLETNFTEFKSRTQEEKDVYKNQGVGLNEDPENVAQKHYIKQAEYVFDGDEKVVQHVIHYENIRTEFNILMKEYGLDVRLKPKEKSGTYTDTENEKRLTYRDLTHETINVINNYAKDDFYAFGYGMVESFEDEPNYSTTTKFKDKTKFISSK